MAREASSGALTVREAINCYVEDMRVSGARERSAATAAFQMRRFFGRLLDVSLDAVTPRKAVALYEDLRSNTKKRLAVATQRECLARAKRLYAWCVERKLTRHNPVAEIKPVGIASRGKAQLRIDEARQLVELCLVLAKDGDDGALAVLMGLLMGLRAGEIVTRTVRDLDAGGAVLCIDNAADGWKPKSRASRRGVEVPEILQPLLRQRALAKQAGDLLFAAPFAARHRPDWVRVNTGRLCGAAGVPVVCAHALRGQHATIAIRAGVSPSVVAAALGQASPSITLAAYAEPGSLQIAHNHQAVDRLVN